MNKNYLIGLLIIIILVIGGYFIQRGSSKQVAMVAQSDKAIDTLQTKNSNIIPKNKQTTSAINSKSEQAQSTGSVTKQNIPVQSDLKTYANDQLGISFQFPSTWAKQGQESNATNSKGEVMVISANFMDTVSNTTFFIEYHLAPYGLELYKNAEAQFNSSQVKDATAIKQKIKVAGNEALETSYTMDKDIKGKIYDPQLRIIRIIFLDDKQAGEYNLNFKTPLPDCETEIAKFKQTLATFKFIH